MDNSSQKDNVERVESTEVEDIGFVHSVYFWLKEDATEVEKEKFESSLAEMAKIESISKVYYGPPAMTPRSVVDNSYDYAWITFFKNKAAHDAYQIDPIHDHFKKVNADLWERVQIYDSLYQFH